jgi:hypothetical protein
MPVELEVGHERQVGIGLARAACADAIGAA